MRIVVVSILLISLPAPCFCDALTPDQQEAVRTWDKQNEENRTTRARLLAELPRWKPIRFYSLDPVASRKRSIESRGHFHDWVVVAEAAPRDVSSGTAIVGSLRKILETPSNGVAACFDPHHAVRFTDGTRTFDLVICFECFRYYLYSSDGSLILGDSFEALRQERKWDRAFNAAGIARRVGGAK